MTKRLLIDSSHAEETRVVVLDGNRLEDFDVETLSRRQLKGNIYLAKVVRVEPSLQAAFVEYGGNRHGFLAFGEIHPDYYQIPVADRQRLIAMQEEEARAEEEAEEDDVQAPPARAGRGGTSDGLLDDTGAHAPYELGEMANGTGHQQTEDAASGHPGGGLAAEPGDGVEEPPGNAGPVQSSEDERAQPGDNGSAQPDDDASAQASHASSSQPGEAQPAETKSGHVFEDQPPQADAAAPASDIADGDKPDGEFEPALPLLMRQDVLHAPGDEFEAPTDTALQDAGAEELAGEALTYGTDSAPEAAEPSPVQAGAEHSEPDIGNRVRQIAITDAPSPEMVGGETEASDETRAPRQPSRFTRSYKIQEVIRRRQILLIQVVKEERGTKGAALTTYISLAGRYCVLMPNSPRGGGISRKITSAADRRRLKEVTAELEVPRGMGLIVRTAGAARPKAEIKRDGEYLLRLWDDIREQTMASMAPSLIYEEASLIKRAIRDVYSRDIDELVVDGQDGWRAARDYMRMLMPTHVKKVQLWPANAQPLFAHAAVEQMLDAMLSPTVQLRSGGYLVINQTEALVAIDVNSGRSTRERGIEETALRTNLEAAEEAARQLRLRDLAGLIVIDFIDMESKKHNAMVERRIADALRNDRARIQLGHISHFGLLELSRQRLRPSLAETSLSICPGCGGTGHVRSTESAALHVLREIEEEGGRRRAAEIAVHVASSTALYILNNKRQRLTEIEARYAMRVCFQPDESLLPAQTRIDRLRAAVPQELPPPETYVQPTPEEDAAEADISEEEADVELQPAAAAPVEAEAAPDDFTKDADHVPGETAAEGEQRRRRRRRRRRGGRREDGVQAEAAAPLPEDAEQPDIPDLAFPTEVIVSVPGHDEAAEAASQTEAPVAAAPAEAEAEAPVSAEGEAEPARAKRGRRGGRRRRKPDGEAEAEQADAADAPAGPGYVPPTFTPPAFTPPAYVPPVFTPPAFTPYVGPTPADPFAMAGLDIFDAIEQAEQRTDTTAAPGTVVPPAASAPVDEPSPSLRLVPEEPPAEPVAGPAIQPIIVGNEAADAPKRKGWWRK